MKHKRIIKTRYQRTMLSSALITLFIISLISAAAILMGVVYKESRYMSFGEQVVLFDIKEKDVFLFLGNEVHIPLMTVCEKIGYIIKQYSPGIIKLLLGVVNTLEELSKNIPF